MDNQQSPTAGTPIYQESNQGKNAKWLWLLIALIIIAALVFAFIRGIGPFTAFKSGEEAAASPTPLLSSSPSPTPAESTPGANLDRSEPSIRVLNGNGTSGVASTMKNLLEEKGYIVDSVGNAESFDFESTTLRFKESFQDFEELLVEDLSDDYSVTVSKDVLDEDSTADIEIIVGAK